MFFFSNQTRYSIKFQSQNTGFYFAILTHSAFIPLTWNVGSESQTQINIWRRALNDITTNHLVKGNCVSLSFSLTGME